MSIKKLFLIFTGLFVLFYVGGIVTALIAGHPIDFEKQVAENFYYAAIGFAVYHIFTRNKQIREDREKKDAADRAAAEEQAENADEPSDAAADAEAEKTDSRP